MKWQNVYIFISSTFNDMHAERDYLIKRVFPELRLWCAEHKLKLIDIDLRWGVSEKDATENKRVVDVCLNNVDKCRPFLLALLGQRRGWVPGLADINEETLLKYPGLKEYIGKRSITELEIIHGLLHPLADGTAGMRHAFFYHRQPDYIGHIDQEETRRVFELETDDAFLDSLKETYEVIDYCARWNPEKVSPELKNVRGMDLSKGRLENFRVGDAPLANVVSAQLKAAIRDEFPEHFAAREEMDELGQEWNHQDNFLFSACDSYIPRGHEEAKILAYLAGDINKPCVFMADAGTGKTSMLAWLIRENRLAGTVIYRFVGTSSASSDVTLTLHQLAQELARKDLISQEDFEEAKTNILLKMPALLRKIKGKCTIILDAVDQWNHLTASSFRWLPETLPENVKLLLSIKKDGQEEIINYLTGKSDCILELKGITDDDEKTAIIVSYLSSFLKDIDKKQMGHILRLPGSGNPLYLKIVLNELRIHGSFDTLMEQLQKDYGTTPKEAFQMVLNRLESETFAATIPSALLVKYVLGTIGCATEGIPVEEFAAICSNTIPECKALPKEEILDAVYGLVRHLSTYLVIDGNRVNFLYDSFRRAVQERYRDDYTQFHHLLAQMYSRICYETGGAEYDVAETTCLTNAIHHAIACAKSWAEALLTEPWFVYRLLTKTSAAQAASYFRRTADKYEDAGDYRELADFLDRYSMRLNIGPNTLFYLMKRYVGLGNPIVELLCQRASRVMELEYYYPVREDFSESLTADKELDLFTGSGDIFRNPEPFVWGQYVIYVAGDTVLFQNIYTEEIEKQISLPRSAYRAYVYGDYLYIHYGALGDVSLGDLETFRLPEMESVFLQQARPQLPEKFNWYTVAFGVDGVQYQYSMDHNETFPELYVYNMNTGKTQIHSTFAQDTLRKAEYSAHDVKWCGEYLKEEIRLFRKCRIWHVPTGTMLLETDELWTHLIACEKKDMWYVTVTKEGNLTAYHYAKEGQDQVSLIGKYEITNKLLFRVKQIGILDSNLYLFFDSGDFWVFDRDFQFIGRQKLPFTINLYSVRHFSGNQFLYSHGAYLFFLIESQLLLFDKQKCMESLLRNMELSRNTESYTTRQFDNRLVLLEKNGCHVLNLRTLNYSYSEKYPGFSFYEPTIIHVGSNRFIGDTRVVKGQFEVLMVSSYDLSIGLRFHGMLPEGTRRPELMFYHNGIAGVVFWDDAKHIKEVREHKTNPELERSKEPKQQKIENIDYESYTVAYYNVRDDFKCIDTWKPDFCATGHGVMHYTSDKTPYLVFTDVYVDIDHSEIRIYHATTKELVYAYRYDHTTWHVGSRSEFYEIDNKLFVRMFNYETTSYHFLEIDLVRRSVERHPIPTRQISGENGRELYFFQSFDRTILIYDLDQQKIKHEIAPRLRRFCYGVFRKGNRLLICLSGGICEVYDGQTLQYLYSQMLMPSFSVVKDLEGTDMLYVSKNSSDYAIFKAGNTKTLMDPRG